MSAESLTYIPFLLSALLVLLRMSFGTALVNRRHIFVQDTSKKVMSAAGRPLNPGAGLNVLVTLLLAASRPRHFFLLTESGIMEATWQLSVILDILLTLSRYTPASTC